jgi:DNA-binding NarL/FixJ family response regulator
MSTPGATPTRILVVDDSSAVRSSLAAIIEHEPGMFLAGTASNPTEALDVALKVGPDVVVLDINMPDGGGTRAARTLTQQVPSARIVSYSAFDADLIKRVMRGCGARAHVSKSASIPELLATIRRVAAEVPAVVRAS